MGFWSAYLLGLATPVMTVAVGYAVLWSGFRAKWWLEARGWLIECRWKRGDATGLPSDYNLRRDVWWERRLGPIFVGGWYREEPKYEEPSRAKATRWLGLGRTTGPCVSFMRLRELGPVEP